MAWNIAGAAYSRNIDTSSQTSDLVGLYISPDGLKMYITAYSNDKIYEYTLSEAWNISTASYVQNMTPHWGSIYGLFFKSDGTKMYVSENNTDLIVQYNLSSAWDISTASYVQILTSIKAVAIFFKSDGTKLYFTNSTDNTVREHTLSSAWDISTASYVQSFSFAGQSNDPYGLFFSPDGTMMYVTDAHPGGTVFQYELSSAWDISTASYTESAGTGDGMGLSFKSDGTRFYVGSNDDNDVKEFDLPAGDYYVKTDGNDADTGIDWDHAWLTIDHAQSTAGVQDNIHIAAGTYDEAPGFLFTPPAGSVWLGAGAALTKLFTARADTYTIANAGVEIYDCQVGDDPGGAGSGITVNADGDDFIMQQCSNRATLLSFMGVDNMLLSGLSGGTVFFAVLSSLTDSTFEDIVSDVAGTMFSTAGTGLTFNDINLPNLGDSNVTCPIGSMSRCVFKRLSLTCGENFIVDDLEVGSGGLIIGSATSQTITNCKTLGKITVNVGAPAILSWYLKKFYEPSNESWTAIDAAGQTVCTVASGSANITFTERSFLITTNDDISVLITSWETSGYQNKSWTVEATGSRAITFQLGDMLANRKYNLMVGDEKVSHAKSNASGVVVFPEYSGSFSTRAFTTELVPPLLTHDEIRTAILTTLQADTDIAAEVETWLRYLINTGQITYPAVYIGEIRQPFDGECGSEVQHTSIANPMEITVGVLSNTHAEAVTELGELYELIFDCFKDNPTVGLHNFDIHSIAAITTKPIPECGRSIIRAELTLHATWVRSND